MVWAENGRAGLMGSLGRVGYACMEYLERLSKRLGFGETDDDLRNTVPMLLYLRIGS